jgi:hypothetical protein
VTGPSAVASKLSFRLRAPSSLAGRSRDGVQLVRLEGSNGALVTYGRGLGGIAVLQYRASRGREHASSTQRPAPGDELSLPKVSLRGVSGEELQTSLGTAIRFQRHGVDYVVAGSVPRSAAEEAARSL